MLKIGNKSERLQRKRKTLLSLFPSFGTFSTGINIKNLHNVIFAFHQSLVFGTYSLLVESFVKQKDKVKSLNFMILQMMQQWFKKELYSEPFH